MPMVLRIPAPNAEAMLKQIELKVMLQQYEKLLREEYDTQLQLQLIAAKANPALSETERFNLEQEMKYATDEKVRKEAEDRRAEKEKSATAALEKKLEALMQMRAQMGDQAMLRARELEGMMNAVTPQPQPDPGVTLPPLPASRSPLPPR